MEGEDMSPCILVIDDDTSIRESLKDLFSLEGFECELAESGKAGIYMFESKDPDLVVTDVQLPDMSGYQLCQTLRRQPIGSRVPLVMISGRFTESPDRIQGLELGADEYFHKPFDPVVFIARIKNLLRPKPPLADVCTA
jgi:DNA-binding response OmpR family regulator